MKASKALKRDTKWLFLQQGTCSRTFFYILNQDFGHPKEDEERAIDPLAGGIMQQGYQCGMLWGASMATGAEAYRRCGNCGKSIAMAIKATRHILDSFTGRTGTADCYDITSTDWTSKGAITRYMISGKVVKCYMLADKWAPEAIRAAREGLSVDPEELPGHAMSCAAEVVRKMGGSEEEMAMVAGFAGGLGLSGNGCGALAAAMWMNSLRWCRENPGKSGYNNPAARQILEDYMNFCDYEFLCRNIAGRDFNSTEEHTVFIREGGCGELIQFLSKDRTG